MLVLANEQLARCYLERPVRRLLPPRAEHRWQSAEPGPLRSSPSLTVSRKRTNNLTDRTGEQPGQKKKHQAGAGEPGPNWAAAADSGEAERTESTVTPGPGGFNSNEEGEQRTRPRTETRLGDKLTVGFTSAAGNCCWRAHDMISIKRARLPAVYDGTTQTSSTVFSGFFG